MSGSLGEAVIDITGDYSGLKDSINDSKGFAESAFGSLGGVIKGVLAVGAAAAVGAITGLVGGISLCVKEAMEAQVTQAQLAAVIESTGGASGVTADMANDLATSLSEVTRFSDDAIVSGESMLLTFTGIGKDVFPAATQTMLDMAQAMGGDLKGTAIQLGKALNSPKDGLSALTKVGVTFTEEQKKLVESLQASGDMAGAQNVILAELQKEFGGSAVAAGQTFAGQLDILKNSLLNVAEGIGTQLLPMGQKLLTKFGPAITGVAQAAAAALTQLFETGNATGAFETALGGLEGVFTALGINTESQVAIFRALWGVYNSISAFVTGTLQPAFTTLVAWAQGTLLPFLGELWSWMATNLPIAIQTLSDFWTGTLLPAIMGVWSWVQTELIPLLAQLWGIVGTEGPVAGQQLSDFWNNVLLPVLNNFWAWTQANILPLLADLWNWLKVNLPIALQTLADFYNDVWLPAQIAANTFIINNVLPLLGQLWDWLKVNLPAALQTLSDFWTNTLQPAIATVWAWVQGTLFPLLTDLWNWLATNVPAALQTLSDFWTNTLLPAITNVWSWMTGTLFPFFKELADFLNAAFTLALTAIAGIWEKVVLPAIESVWKMFNDNVMPIIKDIAEYLNATFGPALKAISDFITGTMEGAVNGLVSGALTGLQNIWTGINQGIKDATEWLQKMADKLATIKLPDWMTPGSPTPWEMGLRGISRALKDVANTQLPNLAANLQIQPVGGAGLNGGAGNQTTNNWNLSVNTQRSLGNVTNDFAVMQVLAGA